MDSKRPVDVGASRPEEGSLEPTIEAAAPTPPPSEQARGLRQRGRWLVAMVGPPLLFLLAGVALLALLGAAQRAGWLTSVPSASHENAAPTSATDYICPMMCTPPQQTPGRCPVCVMELVAAAKGGVADGRSIEVEPATRRVANIHTAEARRVPLEKTVRAVGEIQYDEGRLKEISAYTDGRFERLYVDYTGAVVRKGDRLASFYSPQLYSSQVEYLETTAALVDGASSRASLRATNRRLQSSARQRLLEFGMSDPQIEALAAEGKPRHRLDIVAPISGTVVEKLVVEGQYVKEGDSLFKLADLETVWLILRLFPKDAAAVRYGQQVEAEVRSLPGRRLSGRIAFVDPAVDPETRTVSVRVVLENQDDALRIGEYARAEVRVPVQLGAGQPIYDPELANKWISPRHPHIVRDKPGPCPRCGEALVAASELGFTDVPQSEHAPLVVPRSALLHAAGESVAYVESEPGRFEVRRVVTGAIAGDAVVVMGGIQEGEKVATRGGFLLDSQMQLAGNPSLIDPSRLVPGDDQGERWGARELAHLEKLPVEQQTAAMAQVICPVTDHKLGAMGVPLSVEIKGKRVFVCCKPCLDDVLEDPDRYLAKLADRNRAAAHSAHQAAPAPEAREFPAMGPIELIEPAEPRTETVSPRGANE